MNIMLKQEIAKHLKSQKISYSSERYIVVLCRVIFFPTMMTLIFAMFRVLRIFLLVNA